MIILLSSSTTDGMACLVGLQRDLGNDQSSRVLLFGRAVDAVAHWPV